MGTATYTLSEDWRLADGFYFAVCTLTTSSIADPHLTLSNEPIKIFTAFYVLVGIGILVEVARQIGFGFVAMRTAQSEARRARATATLPRTAIEISARGRRRASKGFLTKQRPSSRGLSELGQVALVGRHLLARDSSLDTRERVERVEICSNRSCSDRTFFNAS